MSAQDAWDFLQKGGVLAFCILLIWALLDGKIIRRGEFDNLKAAYDKLEKSNDAATEELIKQSTTNAALVAMSVKSRQEAENIRRADPRNEVRDDR